MTNLLTLNETARELRCSRSHLHRIIGGRFPELPPFPTIRLGHRLYIRREAIGEWLLLVEARGREAAYASGVSIHFRDEDMEYFAGA